VRYFAQHTSLEICFAQYFSKNFSLYGQRVGAVHMLARDQAAKPATLFHLIRIVQSECSSSPSYGCRIVAKVLNDPALRKQWKDDNIVMSSRIRSMREALYSELQRLQTPGTWEHVINQVRNASTSRQHCILTDSRSACSRTAA
jgi:aspartate aminotransferase, cytoplasmic